MAWHPGRAGCLHAGGPVAVTGAGVRPSISHRRADTGAQWDGARDWQPRGAPARRHQAGGGDMAAG